MFSGITEDDTKKLIALYQKTEASIVESLRGVNIVNRIEKEGILRQIQTKLEALGEPTKDFLDLHVEKEYKAGMLSVNETLGQSFALVNKEAVESLVSTAYEEIRLALGQSKNNIQLLMNRLTRDAKQKVLEATGNALITGQARKGLSEELYKILKADGITGYRYTDKNGKAYNVKLETYVDTTARNALRDAQNESVVAGSIKADVDLVKFSTHSNPSPMCSPWQGKVVSIRGVTDGYDTLENARTWFKGIGMCNHRYCLLPVTNTWLFSEPNTSQRVCPIGEIGESSTVTGATGIAAKVTSKMVINYRGNIHTLIFDEFQVSGTPDHACLSKFGFIPFEGVKIGDAMIKHDPNINRVLSNCFISNPKNFKTVGNKKIISNSIMINDIKVATPINFNNEIVDYKIDYISTDNNLSQILNVSKFKPFFDPRFKLVGFSLQDLRHRIASLNPDIFTPHITTIINEMLLGSTAWNTELFHRLFDGSRTFSSEHYSDLFSTFIFFIIDPFEPSSWIFTHLYNLANNNISHIIDINVLSTHCQVIDIEVEGGQYIIEGGLVSHNCRHRMTPYNDTNIKFKRYNNQTKEYEQDK